MMNNATVSVERQTLDTFFPDKLLLNKKDVCSILGCRTYDTLKKMNIPWNRNGKISKVALAKWLEK